MYHVMSRGDRREDIFLDDVDRQDFLKTLAEACQKAGWEVHAYCLMRNPAVPNYPFFGLMGCHFSPGLA
jgi:REP element-mobilizing transposase RayT